MKKSLLILAVGFCFTAEAADWSCWLIDGDKSKAVTAKTSGPAQIVHEKGQRWYSVNNGMSAEGKDIATISAYFKSTGKTIFSASTAADTLTLTDAQANVGLFCTIKR